jgi:hypothetical protein
MFLPRDNSTSHIAGGAAGVALPAGGLRSGDTILACIRIAGGTLTGVNPAVCAAGNGTVTIAGVDTAGENLAIISTR